MGGLFALLWYAAQKAVAQVPLKVKWRWLVVALLVSAGAGVVSVMATYRDQDVWTWSENGWAAAVAAFTGATTGTTLVLLSNFWEKPAARADAADETPTTAAAGTATEAARPGARDGDPGWFSRLRARF